MEDIRVNKCIERAHHILTALMAVKPGGEILIMKDGKRSATGTNRNFAGNRREYRAG